MLDQRRQQYLQAMGITVWRMRTDSPVEKPPATSARPDSNSTEHFTTTSTSAPSGWLIWLNDDAARNHWALILQDLQALCLSTQLDNPPAAIITSQPKELPKTTGILAIGLTGQQLAWLKSNGNCLVELPALATWHNQPGIKQKLWRTLQEQLW